MPGRGDASGKLRNKSRLIELKVRVINLKSYLYIDDLGFPFYFINRQKIDSETDFYKSYLSGVIMRLNLGCFYRCLGRLRNLYCW